MHHPLLLPLALAATAVATPAAVPAAPAVARGATLQAANVPYDGRFTFVRLKFEPSGGYGFMGPVPPWAHDYPRAERNLMKILDGITLVGGYTEGGNILKTDDPELFQYPVAYMSEPGYWTQTEAEARGLRDYLRKGGFLIVDDFRGGDLANFRAQMQRVLPGAELVEMDVSDPVFHSFFDLESLQLDAPYARRFTPVFYGIYEDNDPARRLLAVANYNNDIGDDWEWSDTGWMPVEISSIGFKLGVNYIVYAMTH